MNKIIKNICLLLLILIVFSLATKAHEEPSKTLKEKKEKAQKKQQIFISKIKTSTVWKYDSEKKIVNTSRHKAFVMGYDSTGNFLFIEAYRNDSLVERDEYIYSVTDDMISEIDYSPEGKMLEENSFTFDKAGRLVSGFSKMNNDSLTEHFTILPGKDKRSLEYNKYSKDNSIEYKLVYKYADDFDKCDYSKAYKYDSKGKLLMKVVKKYNLKGLQIEKAIFDSIQKLSYSFVYEYDTVGNNTKITKMNAGRTIEWENFYSYSDKGNCTGLKSHGKDKKLKTTLVYEYEYYQ